MSKIIKLSSENVKRLQAVEITPSGNVVVVGGKNGAGKSSVLDSIEFALGGDPSAKMPVRRGEEKARVVVDLGDIIVKRTFTAAGGTSLVVTNADGVKQSTPQAILDKLVGKLTFDPLAFSREKPKQQAETLRALVNLDFTAHDAEREKLFNERTAVNREAKALEARIAGIPRQDGLPTEEVSASDILAEQEKAAEQNNEYEQIGQELFYEEDRLKDAQGQVEYHTKAVANAQRELERWQKQIGASQAALEEARQAVARLTESVTAVKAKAAKAVRVDLQPFKVKLGEVEATNRKIRQARERAGLVAQFKEKVEAADRLTNQLESLDSARRKAVTEAKYPVDGLAFDAAGGVTFNNIPFEQCSSAEQLKVSVAVGLALNPKLKVLLIRDGSLLDEASLQSVLEMAKAADAQVWVERVGMDATTSVVIEDGRVAITNDAATSTEQNSLL